MDLGAYMQIEDLKDIASENGIEVPRLRGYRLMKDVEFIPIEEMLDGCEIEVCERLCRSDPLWDKYPGWGCRSVYVEDLLCNRYLVKNRMNQEYTKYSGVRWDRIHGKKRRTLKFEIKKKKRRIVAQYSLWNKYAGKDDVLYIHARIGGSNWEFYGGSELTKQPWFLEKIDDCFDGSYCDIYASINR